MRVGRRGNSVKRHDLTAHICARFRGRKNTFNIAHNMALYWIVALLGDASHPPQLKICRCDIMVTWLIVDCFTFVPGTCQKSPSRPLAHR